MALLTTTLAFFPISETTAYARSVQKDPQRHKAWRDQWLATDVGKAWQTAHDAYGKLRATKLYVWATVGRDGGFRIDDLPAGDYVLRVQLRDQLVGRLSDYHFSVPPERSEESPPELLHRRDPSLRSG